MIIKTAKVALAVILLCCVSVSRVTKATVQYNQTILLLANWGARDGEFGREKLGKTELGYAIDFKIYKNRVYILDSINNRIQIFGLDGKFVTKIDLDINWLKNGLAWEFAILHDNLHMLIAPPPYFSPMNVGNICEYSLGGKFQKKYGHRQINIDKGEYYYNIIGIEQQENIVVNIGESSKAIAFDNDGRFVATLTDDRAYTDKTLKLKGVAPLIVDIPGHFRWRDKDGNYYRIKSNSSSNNNFAITTEIQIYNPDKELRSNVQLSGDVQRTINGRLEVVRYRGNYTEFSEVTAPGIIYHLIALDDGVVLRKIELNPK